MSLWDLKTDGGAVGDGVADDTAALNAAAGVLNTGRSVFMPAGRYKKTAETTAISPRTNVRLCGEGAYASVIVPTGAGINGLVLGGTLCNVNFEDFGVEGVAGTGRGIYAPATTQLYNSYWRNLYLDAGSDAVAVFQHFSHRLTNVQANSWAGHAFLLRGGNTVALENCYAQRVRAPGKAGFRLGTGVSMRSCNGVDQGDYWGIFGADAGDPDFGTVIYPNIHLDGCNVEDFAVEGVRLLRESKKSVIRDTTFLAKSSGSFNTHIHVYAGNAPAGYSLRLDNVNFETKGATRVQPSNIVADFAPLDAVGVSLDDNDYYALDQHALLRFHNLRAKGLDLPRIATANPNDARKSIWVDNQNRLNRGT